LGKRTKVRVRVHGRDKYYAAERSGIDPTGDLALLKIPGIKDLPFAEFGDVRDLRVGQAVFALGDPFAMAGVDGEPTLSLGVIGALHRFQNAYSNAIQTDAALNPGNSGGPLFTLDGKLVGINGQIAARFGTLANTGIGYAIPADQIQQFLPLLKAAGGGVVHHAKPPPGLRLKMTSLDGPEGLRQQAEVIGVEAGSSAAEAGFQPGDIIVAVDGLPVINAARWEGLVRGRPGDSTLDVLVRRGEETVSLKVSFPAQPLPIGIRYGVPRRELGGWQVAAVDPDSAAGKAGVKAGDVVRKLDGVSLIANAAEFVKVMNRKKPGDTVELELLRHAKNPGGNEPLIETIRVKME
jgi:serine protease Do